MASDDRRHALLLLVILLHSPELAAASPCVDDLFIPLVVYFFVTIALGATGAVYVLVRRHPTLHSGDAPDDAHKGGSVIFDADIDDAGRGEATGRQSWEIKFSELRFGRCIGVGNVGEVYKGMFRGRTVAIKKLLGSWLKDDDMVARFKDEILLMSTMNHTNVLSFYGAVLDREAGQICLVMELCERGTLEELLRSPREPLSWLRRLKMARAIALGMDYVHSKAGIIQRDLKAANLLVTREYDVKIADFGLSRSMRSGAMETYCGTPAYMAPEIVRQEAYSEKADVFSYGIILWELLTRQVCVPGGRRGRTDSGGVSSHQSYLAFVSHCFYATVSRVRLVSRRSLLSVRLVSLPCRSLTPARRAV